MTKRQARSYEAMSPEQRAAVDRIRTRHATPEHRDEEDRVREAIEAEFPPLVANPETVAALALLRVERERRGLSLADISERAGIDRTALSKLERGLGNPTISTLNRLASALGMRWEWVLVEAEPGR
jgi:DNA-binding phage protein